MVAEAHSTTSQGEARQQFQRLKTHLHRRMIDAIDLSKAGQLDESELRQQLRSLASHLCSMEEVNLPPDQRELMVREIMDEIYGFGPLEPLMNDPEVSDVLVNGPDRVFVERNGILQPTNIRFADDQHLLRLIHRLVGRAGRRIDEVQPMVDAKLPDGSRLNAVIPPLALQGPTVSIRRFRSRALLFEDMVSMGSLAPEMADFLVMAVRGRLNMLISGGTGSGKTTMLNALSSYIDPRERIVTIEDAAELQLQQNHVVRLETRPPTPQGNGSVGQRDLVRNALRMRPDRIIVGEVRGAEAFDMLQAMNTGHDGSMTTVHANSARDAISRLEQMVTMMGIEFPLSTIRAQIASGLHFVVQLTRLSDGKRRVVSVSEITGMEGEVLSMQDIFVYRREGRTEAGEVLGRFMPTGIRPKCMDQLLAAGVDLGRSAFRRTES